MIPAWGRLSLLGATLRHLARIAPEVEVLVVGSEGQASYDAALDNGASYLQVANDPLGAKFDAGVYALRDSRPDGVLMLGCDDFASRALIDTALDDLDACVPYSGLLDFYGYDLMSGALTRCPGYRQTAGAGWRKGDDHGGARLLSSSLLDALDWRPWGGNASDWSMTCRVRSILGKNRPRLARVRTIAEAGAFVCVDDGKGLTNFANLELLPVSDGRAVLLDALGPETVEELEALGQR